MSGMFRPVFGRTFPLREDLVPAEVPSHDGSRLEAAIGLAKGPAAGVVVLCHPFLKYGFHYFIKSGMVDLVTGFGCHAVLFNFKGFGKSELKGPAFYDDAIGAVAFARQRFPGLPVHLAGFSFGGYHGIHALARMDGEVKSAFFDSVPVDATNYFKGPVKLAFRLLNAGPWGRLCGTEPILRDLAAIRRTPLHFLFGENDRYLSPAESAELKRIAPGARTCRIPHAGHLQTFKTAASVSEAFLKAALQDPTPIRSAS